MHFRRVVGSEGYAPGRFEQPWGVAVARGLLVVSERLGKRLQVLTLTGVPLQTMTFSGNGLFGLCADEERVWVCGWDQVHELMISLALRS